MIRQDFQFILVCEHIHYGSFSFGSLGEGSELCATSSNVREYSMAPLGVIGPLPKLCPVLRIIANLLANFSG
jgi:hypothetical protein